LRSQKPSRIFGVFNFFNWIRDRQTHAMFATQSALTVQQQATVKLTQAQFMLIYGCSVVHALASWKPRRIRSGPVDFEQRFTSAFRLFEKPFSYKVCTLKVWAAISCWVLRT
jgi:hypothetical protein